MYEHNLNISAFRVNNLIGRHIRDNNLPYYIITSLPENNQNIFMVVLENERYLIIKAEISLKEANILELSYKRPLQRNWTEPTNFEDDLDEIKNFLTNYN